MVNRKTQEEWEKEYKGLTGDEYTFLEPYQKSNAKIACRHNKCGYEWKVTPHIIFCMMSVALNVILVIKRLTKNG